MEFFISRTQCFLLIIRSLTAAAVKPNIGLNQYTFCQRARGLSRRRRKLRGCKFLSQEYLCLDPKFGCLIPRLYWLPSLTFPNRRTQSMKAVSLFVSNEHINVHLVQTQYCCTNGCEFHHLHHLLHLSIHEKNRIGIEHCCKQLPLFL